MFYLYSYDLQPNIVNDAKIRVLFQFHLSYSYFILSYIGRDSNLILHMEENLKCTEVYVTVY